MSQLSTYQVLAIFSNTEDPLTSFFINKTIIFGVESSKGYASFVNPATLVIKNATVTADDDIQLSTIDKENGRPSAITISSETAEKIKDTGKAVYMVGNGSKAIIKIIK